VYAVYLLVRTVAMRRDGPRRADENAEGSSHSSGGSASTSSRSSSGPSFPTAASSTS
jgi:hypothetical protein